jgi:hypothetical protein
MNLWKINSFFLKFFMEKWVWALFFMAQGLFCGQYYKTKKIIDNVQSRLKNSSVKLLTPELPNQFIEILEYGDNYVIIKGSNFLGLKHCFYKAIEFFNSKYTSFFIKIGSDIHREKDFIIVKFIAYNIKK